VVETRGEPDLPNEPFRAQHLRQLRMEDLESYRTVVPKIAGQVDGGHAAAAELALEDGAVGQGGLERFFGLGQRDLSERGSSRLHLKSFLSQSAADCDRAAGGLARAFESKPTR
jgi:hypothetical protein